MANRAALHLRCRMLKNKRPSLLLVTRDAGFETRPFQQRPAEGAVGVVAVRTLHKTFGNAMMRGQGKQCLDGPMAGIAEFRLRFPQQEIGRASCRERV